MSKADVDAVTGRVTIGLAPAAPGTYTELVNVFTNAATPDRLTYNYRKTVTVTYTVTPYPALDAFFWPATGNFVRAQADTRNLGESDPMVVTNTGVSYQWRPVEYLSHPSAANGHPLADAWWINSGGITTCTVFNDPRTCLPPGTYTARHRYSITKDGNTYDVYWPMSLQINP
ncbi:MAG: hypothetical protein JWQ76_4333 [Ramlibacter sp.]|nr:hypothetical protein [Ramlibacter sp.]